MFLLKFIVCPLTTFALLHSLLLFQSPFVHSPNLAVANIGNVDNACFSITVANRVSNYLFLFLHVFISLPNAFPSIKLSLHKSTFVKTRTKILRRAYVTTFFSLQIFYLLKYWFVHLNFGNLVVGCAANDVQLQLEFCIGCNLFVLESTFLFFLSKQKELSNLFLPLLAVHFISATTSSSFHSCRYSLFISILPLLTVYFNPAASQAVVFLPLLKLLLFCLIALKLFCQLIIIRITKVYLVKIER